MNPGWQVPCQLLREPHPARVSWAEHRSRLLASPTAAPAVLLYPTHWRPYCVELGTERNPVVCIQHPGRQTRSLLQYGQADTLVTVSSDATVGQHSWLPYDRNLPNHFYLERDPSLGTKTRRRLPGPFPRNLVLRPGQVRPTVKILRNECCHI